MRIDRHIIAEQAPLTEALRMLNDLSGGVMTLIVIGPDGRMTGTLTDGDVRRALLSGVALDSPVSAAMFRGFHALRQGEIDPAEVREIRKRGIRLIPVLDSEGRVVRLIDTVRTRTILPVGAVLMAGGKGERLRPMTLTTVGKEALAAVGVTDISVTVNYLAEQLEEHFASPVGGVNVRCVRETRPLGTIGSVALVGLPAEGDTIVMNSDLLTTVSFEDLYLRHISEKADITIAVVSYNVSVPYAILATEGERVTGLVEKPSYSYYANAGIYIFSNRILSSLSPDNRMDAPDLIEQTIAEGGKVTYYPINGTWIDIGSPADFAHARELMVHVSQTR